MMIGRDIFVQKQFEKIKQTSIDDGSNLIQPAVFQVFSKINLIMGTYIIMSIYISFGCTAPKTATEEMIDQQIEGGHSTHLQDQGSTEDVGLSCEDDSTPEICDMLDNDCDGKVDEDFTGLGEECERRLGQCVNVGVFVCGDDGERVCNATTITQGDEVCDEIDNDCDGSVDEGFNLMIDRDHCGVCTNICMWNHGNGRCEEGVCLLTSCEMGWEDVNQQAADGCECNYEAIEVCDGVDNNCDGNIDEDHM